MRECGVQRILVDVEDPGRIRGVYPDEAPREVEERCRKRLRWFQRAMGAIFFDDPSVPYRRPASDDPRDVQAYDLLGIVPIEADDPDITKFYNSDRTAARIELYERLYLELMQLEYGDATGVPTLQDLAGNYRAIDEFMRALNAARSSMPWLTLRPTRK